MVYNLKDVFFLDASALTTTGTGDFCTNMDISSYVQPVVRKGIKPTGLAIYKVHWDIADDASNDGLAAATTTLPMTWLSPSWIGMVPQLRPLWLQTAAPQCPRTLKYG